MMAFKLTSNSIKRIVSGKVVCDSPIMLQILEATIVKDKQETAIALKLSDGKNWSYKFIYKVEDLNESMIRLPKFGVIYVISTAISKWGNSNCAEIYHLSLDVSSNILRDVIGNPTEITTSDVKNLICSAACLPIASIHEMMDIYLKGVNLCAKLIFRSDKIFYSSEKSEGHYYLLHFMDTTKEIRLIHFNSEPFTDIDGMPLKWRSMYIISKFKVNIVTKQYSTVNNCYELTCGEETTFIEVDNDESIPMQNFSFTSLVDLEQNAKDGEYRDVIGVCIGVFPAEPIQGKYGGETVKRVIVIGEESGLTIHVQLWGDWALEDGFKFNHMVLAFRSLIVMKDETGLCLCISKGGYIHVTPTTNRTDSLEAWFSKKENLKSLRSLSNPSNSTNSQESPNHSEYYNDKDYAILKKEFDTFWDGKTELADPNDLSNIEFDDWDGES